MQLIPLKLLRVDPSVVARACVRSVSIPAFVSFVPFMPYAAPLPSHLRRIHSSTVFAPILRSFIRCILSLFSCIGHAAWSLPDLFFPLTCIRPQNSWPDCPVICAPHLFMCYSHSCATSFFFLTFIRPQTSWPHCLVMSKWLDDQEI